MSFSDEERAELIAALSKTADMVELLLRQIDLLIFAQESERRLTDAELKQRKDHQTFGAAIPRTTSQPTGDVIMVSPTRIQ